MNANGFLEIENHYSDGVDFLLPSLQTEWPRLCMKTMVYTAIGLGVTG